jgi:MutS domain V
MNVFLLYRARDFDPQQQPPAVAEELTQDLELQTLFGAMALGDKFLFDVARKVVLSPVKDLDTISYRQEILGDCLANASLVRSIYDIAVEAIERERQFWGLSNKYPRFTLSRAVDVLGMFVGMLAKLRNVADEHGAEFHSDGFTGFFAMLKRELADDYFADLKNHLGQLTLRDGVVISAGLGKGNKGTHYVLRKPHEPERGWVRRILERKSPEYTFHVHPRDESGNNALSELRDRGLNLAANALAQSADHVLSFFRLLCSELAFYLGCLNLHEQLTQKAEPTCFPVAVVFTDHRHSAAGLYDVCLALSQEKRVVGNDLNADGKRLAIITGANQGGKSTFLRSIGLAQLMMQCGMFVPAESFCANLCDGLFTHFKREEDVTMKSGKLDEELARMSEIVDLLAPNTMVLFNESFAATNEREGSEIARQIVSALLERRIKIFFVTHLYEFARSCYEQQIDNSIFLRAERRPDGTRTFKLLEGEPLQTSYGQDLYTRIFDAGHTVNGTETVRRSVEHSTRLADD